MRLNMLNKNAVEDDRGKVNMIYFRLKETSLAGFVLLGLKLIFLLYAQSLNLLKLLFK